ncbi:MAG: cysteine desulfurase-like protein [Planctomycetales bacterium]|nr:cysteine desulfurase-like protein [Planctomycetales bacterium]
MFDSNTIARLRSQFPALAKQVNGQPAVYFDGPAGTQVPERVIQAIGDYLRHCNANHGGHFATSHESDVLLDECHQAAADFVGAASGDCIAFGANMTSLNFALSRALARTWQPGDEIMVTRLEHDANFTPWVTAAADADVTVRYVDIHPEDCTLDLEDLRSKLSDKTRLIAVGCASNAVGSKNPVQQICSWASEVGAISVLDAVHYGPHDRIAVQTWDCDFLLCSAYKFFGPHVGIMYGRKALLEELVPYKLRPAPNDLPGRWMTGTQNHECIAGTKAAIDYLAELAGPGDAANRPQRLDVAFDSIRQYEMNLFARLLNGLLSNSHLRVYGITDASRMDQRLPTVAFTHDRLSSAEVAKRCGDAGIFVWHGNYYALPLTETIGVEPEGMVRVGLVHYNTTDEVDRLLAFLQTL